MTGKGNIIKKVPLYIPNYRWEINVDCFNGKSVGDKIVSPIFSTQNLDETEDKWQLKLYCKGNSEENSNFLSLYLHHLSKSDVSVLFSVAILNQDNVEVYTNSKVDHLFYGTKNRSKGSTSWGWPRFITETFITDPQNKILENNKFIILCKIIKQEGPIIRKEINDIKNECRLKEFDRFEKLLTNKEFSDITVIADGKNLYLHKCILSTCDVFEAMFRNYMKERNQNEFEIVDIKYEVLVEFFRFIYTGKVNITDKDVSELFIAAEKYCVTELKELCEETLCIKLTKENALVYYNLAAANNAYKLKDYAKKMIFLHLQDFIESPEFYYFDIQHPGVTLELMKKHLHRS